MESIERIGPPQLDLGAADEHILTMREFLAKARVTRDFQDLKADERRLHSATQASDRSSQNAAEAELEAGRIARADDEYRSHRLSFGVGVLLATLLILL